MGDLDPPFNSIEVSLKTKQDLLELRIFLLNDGVRLGTDEEVIRYLLDTFRRKPLPVVREA